MPKIIPRNIAKLDNIPDVNAGSPSDNDALTWDNATNKWIPEAVAAGANVALSNLASVEINTSLISDTDSTDDLGSSAIRWANLYATNLDISTTSGGAGVDWTPTMTSNTAPSPNVVAASSAHASFPPYRLFDNDLTTVWITDPSSTTTGWISFDFGSGNTKISEAYSISATKNTSRAPKDWTFEGSQNNSDWDILDTRTDETDWSAKNVYSFSNTTAYRYYRFNITAINGATDRIQIEELEIFDNLRGGITTLDSGFVGIGRTNPSYKVDIFGDLRASGDLYIGSDLVIKSEAPTGDRLDVTTAQFLIEGQMNIDVGNHTLGEFGIRMYGDWGAANYDDFFVVYDTSNPASPSKAFGIGRRADIVNAAVIDMPNSTPGSGGNIRGPWISTNDSTYDLGRTSKYWRRIYTDKVFLNSTATLDGASAGHIKFVGDLVPTTDDTEWVGEIGTPFKAIKGLVIKDTTDGKHYKVEVINGTITATALD